MDKKIISVFPHEIKNIIAEYIVDLPSYILEPKIVDFYNETFKNLNCEPTFIKNVVCFNPKISNILNFEDPSKPYWNIGIDSIKDNKMDDWAFLVICTNPQAMPIIDRHKDSLTSFHWKTLCLNPSAIPLIEKNMDKIDAEGISRLCRLPQAIPLIEKNMDRLKEPEDWEYICRHSEAISFIEKNISKIENNINCWQSLCNNPSATSLLRNNLHKLDDICWRLLSMNPDHMDLLRENPDKVKWELLRLNPNSLILYNYGFSQNIGIEDWKDIAHYSNDLKIFDNINITPSILKNLCLNPEGLYLVEKNLGTMNEICWENLCRNSNPSIFELIENNFDKMTENCWEKILQNFRNPGYANFILKNIDRIKQIQFSNIFQNYVFENFVRVPEFFIPNDKEYQKRIKDILEKYFTLD